MTVEPHWRGLVRRARGKQKMAVKCRTCSAIADAWKHVISVCPGDDPTCPGHDHGDPCHYRGDDPMPRGEQP